jgi:hypothetical protein
MNTLAVEAVANAGVIPIPPSKDDAVAGLTKYIPTESVTLYVATVSAQVVLLGVGLTPHFWYWFFICLTPLLQLVLFLRQLAVAKKNWKVPIKLWPWWRIIASTLAFAVWALAVPGNPIIDTDSATGGVLAGFCALLVSFALNLFSPFFEK